MRIAFFTQVQLPVAPTTKQIAFEEEESMSEATSHFTEGDSTSIEDLSFEALVAENDTPLPEIDNKNIMHMILSPLEPDTEF